LYAGNAPGLVQNVLQINVRLPAVATGGLWQLMVGDTFSAPFTIAIR
jgi:uncharacterized protein (TIGR03437 family)